MHKHHLPLIEKFFDGVDYIISREFNDTPKVNEVTLNFLLGKFLNSKSDFHRRMLDYNIFDLNYGLGTYGGHINIEFQINEQGSQELSTQADLGIIININDGQKEKGILVQCKKLYLNYNTKKFQLNSTYRAFSSVQFDAIIKKEKEFKKDRDGTGYCYFLYNPLLKVFDKYRTITKFERKNPNYVAYTIDKRPGLKVIDTEFIKNIKDNNQAFSLENCYKESIKNSPNVEIPFINLSSFIIQIFNCKIGSTNKEVIKLAKGQKTGNEDIDFSAKNTIRINANINERFLNQILR